MPSSFSPLFFHALVSSKNMSRTLLKRGGEGGEGGVISGETVTVPPITFYAPVRSH